MICLDTLIDKMEDLRTLKYTRLIQLCINVHTMLRLHCVVYTCTHTEPEMKTFNLRKTKTKPY